MTIWDCRTHVRMTLMTSSVERTDLDFKISVALAMPIYGQGHTKTCLMSYANNKGADQPAQLISTFFVRCLDNMICTLAISKV